MLDPQPTPQRDGVSEASLASIRATCRRIAATHGLGEPVQRELCAHMEDKLLAYLSGAEKLSEADALLLVEKHFGDPAVLGTMLGEVHIRPGAATMLRRLAAAVMATSAGMLAVRAVGLFASIVAGDLIRPIDRFTSWGKGPVELVHPIYGVLSLITAAVLLLRWERSPSAGGMPWYQRWPGVAVLGTTLLTAGAFIATHFPSSSEPLWFGPRRVDEAAALVLLLAHGCLWVWWLDRAAGAVPKMLLGSFAYAVALAAWVITIPVSFRFQTITRAAEWQRFWLLSIHEPGELAAYVLSSCAMIGGSVFLLYYACVRWGRGAVFGDADKPRGIAIAESESTAQAT